MHLISLNYITSNLNPLWGLRFLKKWGLIVQHTILVQPIGEGKIRHFSSSALLTMSSKYAIKSFYSRSIKREYSTSKNNFASYLAGLIEASATWIIHKDSIYKKYSPKILILFNLDDIHLAKKLISLTELGKLEIKKSSGSAIWHIQNQEEFLKLINIINGNMRTPKIEELHKSINWYNINMNMSIKALDLDLSPIDSNAWLAGFCLNKSHFIMTTQTKKHSIKVILKFELMVNVIIPTTKKESEILGYFLLFSKISEYLETSFTTKLKNSRALNHHKKYIFILLAYQPKSKDKVIEYLSKFPLLGKNFRDYELWCETYSSYRDRVISSKSPKNWTPDEISNLKIRKQQNELSYCKNLIYYSPQSVFRGGHK